MVRTSIIGLCLFFITVFTLPVNGKDRVFKWKIITDPYRNYIYPQQTGLKYNLSYNYMIESKSLRRYLDKNFDLRSSQSIKRILRDISSGVYFERFFDFKVRYLKPMDTLVVKVVFENGDTVVEKYAGGNGTLRFSLHLTRYKNQHDFALGKPRNEKQRGLISSVDMMVLSKRRKSGYVMILSKLFTKADMPGIISRINGRSVFR